MVRGFVVGSLALIALYVGVQRGVAGRVEEGGNWAVAGLRRLMSPDVAGIPQRRGGAGSFPKEAKKGDKDR